MLKKSAQKLIKYKGTSHSACKPHKENNVLFFRVLQSRRAESILKYNISEILLTIRT